jgi:hypothetical protein
MTKTLGEVPTLKTNHYERADCRSCGGAMFTALDLGNACIPGFINVGEPDPPQVPLTLVMCRRCRLVQLGHTTPPELLFSKFFYRSSITETMRTHLKQIVTELTHEAKVVAGDSVLDIGANDGTLLGNYPKDVHSVGVEPAANLFVECSKHCNVVISDLFPTDVLGEVDRFQAISAIAMFYDVDEPLHFLVEVRKHLTATGVFVVQMNYLDTMIRDCAIDNIGHEHLTYFNMSTLAPLLRQAGLEPYKVSRNGLNGGSFRVYCSQDGRDGDGSVAELMQEEIKSGRGSLESILRMHEQAQRIRTAIRKYVHNKQNVYLLGASTRGLTLLHFLGLTGKEIVAAGERDERKLGLIIPGANIPIVSETLARKHANLQIILPWAFRTEIIEREQEFLKAGGELLIPLPSPEVHSKNGVRRLL